MTIGDNVKVFDALDKRVEKVLDRIRALTEDNAKLKTKIAEGSAEVDRLRQELASSRKAGEKGDQLSAEITRLEEERVRVRERVSRLIETLESIDVKEA